MTECVSFKERVKNIAIEEALNYKSIFVDKEYLVFYKQFINKPYYIISANPDNYLHLIGVNSHLSAKSFFNKCINKTLSTDDFDFIKPNSDGRVIKGSVRRKIKMLPSLKSLFDSNLLFEENFKRNNVVCAIATSDNLITFGFTNGSKSRPKTLLKGNALSDNAVEIDLILLRDKSDSSYSKIVYGSKSILLDNIHLFDSLIDDKLK